MKKLNVLAVGIPLILFLATMVRVEAAYVFVKEIPLGGEGGWDYLFVDSAARRLYVSHATKVVVVDLDSDKVVGEVTNTPGVHGLLPAPDLGKGFVTCGRENKVHIVDLKTLAAVATVTTGENPDGLTYEPGAKEAYIFNGRGHSATVIDGRTMKVAATIPLDGKPEFPQADSAAARIYVNLEDKSQVAVIDAKSHQVVTNWPIAPGEEPSGMALDAKNHRLFLGCANKLMVMMDSFNGKIVASVPIGDGVDANAFDPGTQLAFASCGDGTTTIAHEDTPGKLTVVQTLKTQRGARTMALDPKTHKIYLATAEFEPNNGANRRGRMVADTFKVLVYRMDSE